MDRKRKTISDAVEELLVKQISHELYNHNLYKTFANYFAVISIPDLERYYEKRATEEYHHHQWIIDRLNEADCEIVYPEIPKVSEEINDVEDPFKLTVLKEIETTELINNIARVAHDENDFQTFTWLQQKLIPEQHEEESISRTALDIISRKDDMSIYEKAEVIYELLEN